MLKVSTWKEEKKKQFKKIYLNHKILLFIIGFWLFSHFGLWLFYNNSFFFNKQDEIYYITFWAIFWYGYETMKLRNIQIEQPDFRIELIPCNKHEKKVIEIVLRNCSENIIVKNPSIRIILYGKITQIIQPLFIYPLKFIEHDGGFNKNKDGTIFYVCAETEISKNINPKDEFRTQIEYDIKKNSKHMIRIEYSAENFSWKSKLLKDYEIGELIIPKKIKERNLEKEIMKYLPDIPEDWHY